MTKMLEFKTIHLALNDSQTFLASQGLLHTCETGLRAMPSKSNAFSLGIIQHEIARCQGYSTKYEASLNLSPSPECILHIVSDI